MAGQKDSGKVNINGKEYETVASRVQRFREQYRGGDNNLPLLAIVTEIVNRDDQQVVMKATIRTVNGDLVIATGYAEESRTSSSINRTSALENAETSAIGRALANFGLAGTEYASADEVAQAVAQRAQPKQERPGGNGFATEAQRKEIARVLTMRGYETVEAQQEKLREMGEELPLTVGAASRVLDTLKGGEV